MQQENNHQHWKQKLENTEQLFAAQPFNKKAAWGKLQQRLHKKSTRQKQGWYWAAAACLLPLLFWLLLPAHQPQKSVVKNNNDSPAKTKSFAKKEATERQELIVKKAVLPPVKMNSRKADTRMVLLSDNKAKQAELNLDSTKPFTALVTPANSDSSASNTTHTIAVASTLKKLQVVHINELNEPVEMSPVLTRSFSPHPFPFQIARGEVHSNDVKAIHTISFISFKTKPLTN